PPSVIKYLETYWMAPKWLPKWAVYFRTERTIFLESDTNMLIDWHHYLKSFLGDGKRNRHLDSLICILTEDVDRFFQPKHQAQLAGRYGHNLKQAARIDVLKRA
ncbi:hypothetical protein C8F01DRAFT_928830, partial [Mycena amicta]